MSKIELLTLFVVLGIIAIFIFITYKPLEQIKKTTDTKRKADLKMLQEVLETYYKDQGRYPKSSQSDPSYRIVRLDGTIASWGQEWRPYMDVLPKDPNDLKNYIYYSDTTSGQSYYLYASLDSSSDKQLCLYNNATKNNECQNVPKGATCGGVCNYGVASANVSP